MSREGKIEQYYDINMKKVGYAISIYQLGVRFRHIWQCHKSATEGYQTVTSSQDHPKKQGEEP